ADIKRDLRNLHTALANLLQYLRREMQTSGGGGDGAAGVVPGKYCLIALAVLGAIRTRNIRRQGHVTDSLDERKKIADWGETQRALAKLAAGDHFSLQLFVLPEKKPLTDADLAPGMHQRLPGKARFIELSGKQRLHLAAQKIACCRIAFAHRLCPRSGAAAQQARGEHS